MNSETHVTEYRKSNIELLRVISMVIIVLSHYVYHGGLLYQSLSINQALAQFLKVGGKIGVTLFVFISAYFLVDSKFKFVNLVKLSLQVSFYAILIIVIKTLITGKVELLSIVKSIFAPIYSLYWFPTAYIGLYLIFPILNIIVRKYDKNIYKLIMILTVPLCFVHFVFLGSNFLYSDLVWFIYLYFFGAMLRKCDFNKFEKISATVALSTAGLIWLSSMSITVLGMFLKSNTIISHAYYFSNITSPLIIICSASIFIAIKKIDFYNSKLINYIAKLTFPVYLLHDNPYFTEYFWDNIVKTHKYFDANIVYLIFHMIIVVILLFLLAAVIEFARTKLEKAVLKLRCVQTIINKVDDFYVIDGSHFR